MNQSDKINKQEVVDLTRMTLGVVRSVQQEIEANHPEFRMISKELLFIAVTNLEEALRLPNE